MTASGLDLVPCHNDPMPGNFLIAPGKPMKLVDYEFSSNNDRAYELAVMVTEMFYGEQQTLELIEDFYGTADWSMTSRVHVCSALADIKWGLWGCVNHQLTSAWDFDYHKYGIWKLMRARMKMADPRWALWVNAL
jgi:thiamine kinase-like enzyme